MIVLDAYALTALLGEEPAAAEVAELLAGGAAVVMAANLAEAADRLARIHGIAVARTRAAVETLEQTVTLRVRPVERTHAWRAAELRAEYYHRTRSPLSLGDCLLLAGTGAGERLATSDRYVLAVAAREGVAWIALPDSRGRRHPPRERPASS